MCRCNGETVAHLLLHCEVAFGLWSKVFETFGIQCSRNGRGPFVWLVELVGEAYFGYMEYSSFVSHVDLVEGAELAHI
jgi:hypothetical protein